MRRKQKSTWTHALIVEGFAVVLFFCWVAPNTAVVPVTKQLWSQVSWNALATDVWQHCVRSSGRQ